MRGARSVSMALLALGCAATSVPPLPTPDQVPAVVIGQREAVFSLPLLADTVAQHHPGWSVSWGEVPGVPSGQGARGFWLLDRTTGAGLPLAGRVAALDREQFTRQLYQGETILMVVPEPALTAEVVSGAMVLRLRRSGLLRDLQKARPDSVRVELLDRIGMRIQSVQVFWVKVGR